MLNGWIVDDWDCDDLRGRVRVCHGVPDEFDGSCHPGSANWGSELAKGPGKGQDRPSLGKAHSRR
jgi:hypothetical protein